MTFKRLVEEYEGKIRFTMVPYMRKYSNHSRDAALAAWAAWDQGKFWEMHDLLFENAPELERPDLERIAKEIGLDMEKFKKALDDRTHLPELNENLDRIHELDIWSTPTVFINGTIYKGAQPYENYKKAIDEILEGKTGPVSFLFKTLLPFNGPSEAFAAESSFGMGKVPLYVMVPPSRPTNEPRVGEEAPDFTLPSTQDTDVTLSDYRGEKNVLLTFLPAAFTPV
ncbi:MAG: thioredoxin domain-containing protein [Proteobacteria bacterium]|nr:thioredoxin domain-containing protein [Pseudomonadota bacterium]